MKVKISVLDHHVNMDLPTYATSGSAGLDLRAAIDQPLVIKKQEFKLVPTGICIELPTGVEAQIRPRSGLSFKHGVTVLNSPGTIDSDYRGEIKVILINLGQEDFIINKGDRIAQMVIAKYEKVELKVDSSLADTSRNDSGFGSTGIK